MNREAWLSEAVIEVSAILHDKTEIEVPEVRVSTGWPSTRGTSLKKRRIGECWKPEVATDGVSQVFISPVLTDPVLILGVLMHELIHAWDKCEHGHRGVFVKTSKAAGLVAPCEYDRTSSRSLRDTRGRAALGRRGGSRRFSSGCVRGMGATH